MTRPQARTAFPVSNRTQDHRPAFVSTFSNRTAPPGKTWFDIKAKKAGDVKTVEVMIYDEIGGWGITASSFVKELMSQEADEIIVHINSPGGDVFDGVAIYNALRMHPADVTVKVEGMAASAASFIAQAGDEVIMLTGSMMMIHDASAFAWGDEKMMQETADILGKISNNIADIYAQRAGGKASTWRDIMREEMWYSAEEAVSAKLADKVDDNENESAKKASDSWDLSVFNYAGRESAPDPLERMLVITNKAQEAAVSPTPTKNTTGEGEETGSTEAPAAPVVPTPPEAPATEPVEDPETTDPVEAPVEPVAPEQVRPVDPPTASAKAGLSFVINGQTTNDPAAVQRHITAMETARNEAKMGARTNFVKGLVTANKASAVQLDSMEKLVASMTDEQYTMYEASWEAAPTSSLFGQHGGGGSGTPSGNAATVQAERIEDLKDIVKNHLQGGMKSELIEATNSFKELKNLQPDFTLADLKK